MKKIIIALAFLPFFASAQDYNASTEQGYQNQSTQQEQQVLSDSNTEIMGRGNRIRCGSRSETKCQGRNVYDTCERDASHGIYGSCRNFNEGGSDVVCGCM